MPVKKANSNSGTFSALCDVDKLSNRNIPLIDGYIQNNLTVNLNYISAIGLSGAAIDNGLTILDGYGHDELINGVNDFDDCLSHTSPLNLSAGFYSYGNWSPCIRKNKGNWNDQDVPGQC